MIYEYGFFFFAFFSICIIIQITNFLLVLQFNYIFEIF
jgi:hypothetical protein